MKRVSFLLYLGVTALAVMLIYSGYVYWQRSATSDQVKLLTKTLADYQVKIQEKENAQIVQAINAKQTVNDLKKTTIKWSKVISEIRETVPNEGILPLAQILSYSGSSANDISLNMKTNAGRENPYLDVAAVIKSFSDSPLFKDSFVPSVSASTDKNGGTVLSFSMGAKYVPPTDEIKLKAPKVEPSSPKLEDSVSDVLSTSLEDKKNDESKPIDLVQPLSR